MPRFKRRKVEERISDNSRKIESAKQANRSEKLHKTNGTKSTSPRPAEELPPQEASESGSSDDDVEPDQTEAGNEVGATSIQSEARKTFADLGVIESLCEACTNLGFKYPTPIQEQSIPLALQGRDM